MKWNVNDIHTNLMIAFHLIPNVAYISKFCKINLFIPPLTKVCMCAWMENGLDLFPASILFHLVVLCFISFYSETDDIDIPTFHTFQKAIWVGKFFCPVSFYDSISAANTIFKCVLKLIKPRYLAAWQQDHWHFVSQSQYQHKNMCWWGCFRCWTSEYRCLNIMRISILFMIYLCSMHFYVYIFHIWKKNNTYIFVRLKKKAQRSERKRSK